MVNIKKTDDIKCGWATGNLIHCWEWYNHFEKQFASFF